MPWTIYWQKRTWEFWDTKQACHKEGQGYPGLNYVKHCQQVRVGNPPPTTQHWRGHIWNIVSTSELISTEMTDIQERVQQRTMKMKWLKHFKYEKIWRVVTGSEGSCGREGAGGISSTYIDTWKKATKRNEQSPSKCSPVTGREETGTNWNKAVSVNIREHFHTVWVTKHCHQGFWCLPPWRTSKNTQTWSSATCWVVLLE